MESIFDITDPIAKLIKPDIVALARSSDITNWKYSTTSRGAWFFGVIQSSSYLLAVDKIDNELTVHGIWNNTTGVGFLVNHKTIRGVQVVWEYVSPSNKFNSFLTTYTSPRSLESRASMILSDMITSGKYINLNSDQLAVKAVQLAINFNKSLEMAENFMQGKTGA